jgi:maltose operon periplasmic protein
MKMNKSLIVLCLSAGLLASAPGISLADVNYVPQNTSDAPAIPSAALQQLTWTPVDQSKTQTTQLATGGQQLNVPGISGPVAAYSVPANFSLSNATPEPCDSPLPCEVIESVAY